MDILNRLRTAMNKRAEYRRTVTDLRGMPLDLALDLDLHRDDAARIARQAVYGR